MAGPASGPASRSSASPRPSSGCSSRCSSSVSISSGARRVCRRHDLPKAPGQTRRCRPIRSSPSSSHCHGRSIRCSEPFGRRFSATASSPLASRRSSANATFSGRFRQGVRVRSGRRRRCRSARHQAAAHRPEHLEERRSEGAAPCRPPRLPPGRPCSRSNASWPWRRWNVTMQPRSWPPCSAERILRAGCSRRRLRPCSRRETRFR